MVNIKVTIVVDMLALCADFRQKINRSHMRYILRLPCSVFCGC